MKKHRINTLFFAFVFSVLGSSLFAEYNPPLGGEDILQFTATQQSGNPVNNRFVHDRRGNPSSFSDFTIPILDISYVGFLENITDQYQLSGHSAVISLGLPLKVGSLGVTSELHNIDYGIANTGTVVGLGASWARSFPGRLTLGVGLRTYVGGVSSITDMGIGADFGISKTYTSLSGIHDLTWAFAIRGMGKDYRPVAGRSALESSFTPSFGIQATVVKNSFISIRPSVGISVPGFQNFRAEIGSDFGFFNIVDVSLSFSLDVAQLTMDSVDAASLLPRISFTFRIPTGNDKKPSLTPGVLTTMSLASWYDGIVGIGAGVSLPLKRGDIQGPEIESSINYIELSPNNDGIQDRQELAIQLTDPSGISEYRWSVLDGNSREVFSAGEASLIPQINSIGAFLSHLTSNPDMVVGAFSIVVNGRGQDGTVLPDGRYSIYLDATDKYGNSTNKEIAVLFIDTEKPEISIGSLTQDEKIFSPNGDGNKDYLRIPQTGSKEDLWVMEFLNQQGIVVYEIAMNDQRPQDLTWDGTDSTGEILPDGVYSYRIHATDRAGNRNSAVLDNILLNSYISPVRLSISDQAFSPNGDGFRDSIEFRPELTKLDGVQGWSIRVMDTRDTTVRTYTGQGIPPRQILFDGRDNTEALLPEGSYKAELSVTYTSGNKPQAMSGIFQVDVTPPQGLVSKEWSIFSPDSDGEQDEILFYQEVFTEESRWVGEIIDEGNRIVKQYIWDRTVPFQLRWDGIDGDTRLVEDGDYRYRLRAEDAAGNRFTSDPVTFTKDTSGAEYLITPEFSAFSPNADGVKDENRLFITQRSRSSVQSYTITIMSANSEGSVRTYSGENSIPNSVRWDGKTDQGRPVADGIYYAQLQVTHNNGSVGTAKTSAITIDTRFPQITISTEDDIFSPDGDSRKDTFRFILDSSEEPEFRGEIQSIDGSVVTEFRWTDALESFEWDGRDSTGNIVDDGDYRLVIMSEDAAGNKTVKQSEPFALDTRKAAVFITLNQAGLAPNNDGYYETIEFGLFMNIVQGLERWAFEVQDASMNTVFLREGVEASDQFTITWDGRNSHGNIMEGAYTAFFTAVYEKGDSPEARSQSFVVDVSGPEQSVSLENTPFSPDGDGLNDELIINLRAVDESSIQAWQFSIFDRNGKLFNTFESEGDVPPNLYWDGISAEGEKVLAAEDYTYTFTTIDRWGNESQSRGVITIDIFVIRDGNQLKIQIASITFLPNSPELVLSQDTPQGLRNALILNRLIELFAKYPSYGIRIEGHAVNITGTQREQEEELIPLSRDRSMSVKQALVAQGMNPNRIEILGVGGSKPIVPHSDVDNRWKNRRVEFILER
ncbi:FlgD immunoglobulin-like domain containing protein [Spirochaeta lutea]|nr:FlgD immunoglobulin-like domain containing protein [Spirochaeta lutea]